MMRTFAGRSVAAIAVGLAFAGGATAQDYRPITCKERQAFQGKPLHSAIDPSLTGVIPDIALPAATAGELDRTFEAMRGASQAQALGIAVGRIGEGIWSRTEAPVGRRRLWWASAGKLFVAVVVLQLVEEGKIALDDVVSRWIERVPNGSVVTVRDLLAHTSGLFSANEDRRLRAQPHYLPPDETLAILRQHAAMFCPGANWRYSNSGYDLLAMIVEAVDRRPLARAIDLRIVQPLALTSVIALTPGQAVSGVAAPVTTKGAATDISTVGAGGPIAAEPADMVRFLTALLSGKVLRPTTVATMFGQLYPMFDAGTFYGLGVMVLDVDDAGRHDIWLGHAGGSPGASSMLAYSPADRSVVAVALTGDGPAAAVANGMFKALRRLAPSQ
jgi:D-alanyl-D-alanine carboxypeptidase